MRLAAYLDGIGVLGPGLNGWPNTAAVLSGRRPYTSAPTVLPTPAMLPAAERRRTGRVVKVALGVALEATAAAAANPPANNKVAVIAATLRKRLFTTLPPLNLSVT